MLSARCMPVIEIPDLRKDLIAAAVRFTVVDGGKGRWQSCGKLLLRLFQFMPARIIGVSRSVAVINGVGAEDDQTFRPDFICSGIERTENRRL